MPQCGCPICMLFYRPMSLAEAWLDQLTSWKHAGCPMIEHEIDEKQREAMRLTMLLKDSPILIRFRSMAENWDRQKLIAVLIHNQPE